VPAKGGSKGVRKKSKNKTQTVIDPRKGAQSHLFRAKGKKENSLSAFPRGNKSQRGAPGRKEKPLRRRREDGNG